MKITRSRRNPEFIISHSKFLQRLFVFSSLIVPHLSVKIKIIDDDLLSNIEINSEPVELGCFDAGDTANLFVIQDTNKYLCNSNFDYANNAGLRALNSQSISSDSMLIKSTTADSAGGFTSNSKQNKETSLDLYGPKIHKKFSTQHRETAQVYPIALLLFEGDCNFRETVYNAMKLNEKFSEKGGARIEYLIIVKEDSNNHRGDFIDDDDDSSDEFLTDLCVYTVDKRNAQIIHQLIETSSFDRNEDHRRDYILTKNSFYPSSDINFNDWSFLITIDAEDVPDAPAVNDEVFDVEFTIMHLILGAVISFPIFLYGILICMSRRMNVGQRDDVETPHYWIATRNNQNIFINGNGPDNDIFTRILMLPWGNENSRAPDLLTDDQIKSLPNIKYGVSDIEEVISQSEAKKTSPTTCTTSSMEKDGPDGKACTTNKNDYVDPENCASKKYLQNAYSNNTSCSICINEFKDKEELLLLPQCGHYFHSECIKPWLTDRKGSCPLCQTLVFTNYSMRSGNTGEMHDRSSGDNNNSLEEGTESEESIESNTSLSMDVENISTTLR